MKKIFKLNPLSVDSILECAKKIEEYRKDFNSKVELFTQRLAEIGVGIAQLNISSYDAIDTANLISSINLRKGDAINNGSHWIIYTDCPYAKYVEFGTGIIGANAQHDLASQFGWEYDINNHGTDGWVYYKNGKYYKTAGSVSKPFMYETALELETSDRIFKLAKEVFR